jgi:hemerythrin-like metal-binding protein
MGLISANHPIDMGEELLDRDHRQIFDYICEIQDLLVSGRKRTLAGSLLRRLEHCSRLHFALEEGMMNSISYPESAHHLLSHLRMTEHMQALVTLFDYGELPLVRKAMDVLSDGHLRHAGGDDKNFAVWLDVPRIPRRLDC